ncbi:hypothetical protein MAR_006825 [Mya arenaria]|uniref:Uncharacterized protein n=1 Tax=Mya arenaria TaxID=6604 RepID=A0ABY7DD85_MYAAR|nr:hypothetical protein MAR_006825 [Mya arenaria]
MQVVAPEWFFSGTTYWSEQVVYRQVLAFGRLFSGIVRGNEQVGFLIHLPAVSGPMASLVKSSRKVFTRMWRTSCDFPVEGLCRYIEGSSPRVFWPGIMALYKVRFAPPDRRVSAHFVQTGWYNVQGIAEN